MKKALKFLTIALVGIVILTGCGKKKEEKKVTLVGEWDYNGFVYTFNEDGTGNYNALGATMEFTYTTEGTKLSILYDGTTAPFETEYKIEDNKLTIKDSFDEDVVYNRK